MDKLDNAIIINGETFVLDNNYDESDDCKNCALLEPCCACSQLLCKSLHSAPTGYHYIKLDKQ